ncbi:MarR family winged helix-turn-helix transcriptional regulator [Corynebacterium lizhenjunii]|uniref:MarR family winged helix-turn-helix transcriptional regulator n=1 Tax=Corynebacterium lizhenjunii TaxID=2709394 RepID=UPI001F1ABB30|nr:MarR family transcriptional regulator [Corynebacterium lizhenjunii]
MPSTASTAVPSAPDPLAEAHRQWTNHFSADGADGLATVTSAAHIARLLRQGAEDALAPYNISYAHFELLTLVMWSRSGGLPMNKISSRLQLPPASLTHTVGKLEKAGLVARVPDPKDKRSLLVCITDQGIALAAAAGPALNAFYESLSLTASEQTQLQQVAKKLRQQAGELAEDSPSA